MNPISSDELKRRVAAAATPAEVDAILAQACAGSIPFTSVDDNPEAPFPDLSQCEQVWPPKPSNEESK